jgi:hypothetical protein
VNLVGYLDTTGLATMDHRVTDDHMHPRDPKAAKKGTQLFSVLAPKKERAKRKKREKEGDAALFGPCAGPERCHTEVLVRLSGSCWCFTADGEAPEVAEPPEL